MSPSSKWTHSESSSDDEEDESSSSNSNSSSDTESEEEETSSSSEETDSSDQKDSNESKEDKKNLKIQPFQPTKPYKSPRISGRKKKNEEVNKKSEDGPISGPKSGRIRRRRPLTICLTHCRYDLVNQMSKRFGLVEVKEEAPWNIYWTDYSVSLERAVEMKRFQIVNHFPGMSEICRKDLLARNLNRLKRAFPEDYNIFPMTWCLPSDNNDLQIYSQSHKGRTYICKPEMGCQGKGIFLVKKLKDLNPFGRIICQLYVQKPFLIDNLKFDLRIYVLITSCDPLRVYVYEEGMARFATAKYRQPTTNNTDNSYMHLTNYSVNKSSRDFVIDEESGTKRKLTTVYKWMEERDLDVIKVKSEIDDVILKTILSAQPMIKHHYKTCFPQHDICSACFEILGFDILLDHKLKPYVIEANHSPSFHTDTVLDKDIKESLLNDSFAMLHLKQIDRVRIEREDRRRVQERLSSKLAEAKILMEEKLNKSKGQQKGVIKDKEKVKDPPAPKPDYSEAQAKWEMEHSGNYRLIYPLEDSGKYDKFLAQNQISLYQETAASQARAQLTRTQMDEAEMKRQIEESKRFGKNRMKEKVRPESPTTVSKSKKKKPKIEKRLINKGFQNCFIVSEEEVQRVRSITQRRMLVRSLGVELQVYNLLSSVGSLKESDHEEFRRKHGFTNNTSSSSISRPQTTCSGEVLLNPSPINFTVSKPTRQEVSRKELSKYIEAESNSLTPDAITEAIISKPPQSDYLKAKWAAHNQQSNQYPPEKRPMSSYNLSYSYKNPMPQNNLYTTRFQTELDKVTQFHRTNSPLTSVRKAEKNLPTIPIRRSSYGIGSQSQRNNNNNMEPNLLPTGPAAIEAIGKEGRGGLVPQRGSLLNPKNNEYQRLYNIYHDRKLMEVKNQKLI